MTSPIHFHSTVLGAPDPQQLARFYANLLGWELGDDDREWATVINPDGGQKLLFQFEENFERPVWPEQTGRQQMMMHLDLKVDNLAKAAAHAAECGAKRADHQPQEDVIVFFDPAGHPFCLFEN